MSDSSKIEKILESKLTQELIRRDEIKRGSENVSFLPNHIYVEPTNMCNLKCATCTPKEIKGKAGKLSLEMWKDIIDYLDSVGAKPTITLIGRGEPLIHPQIHEIVSYARKRDFYCYIISNGTLLNEERAMQLLDAGLNRIQISLHATTPQTYEKMTGKPLYEQVIQNIENFRKLNDERGHPCHLSIFSVVSSINSHEMEEFKTKWEGNVDRVHMHDMFSLHGDSLMAEEVKKKQKEGAGALMSGCAIPWWFFTIRWDGAIVPCALDHASKIVIENIYNKEGKIDLKAAWNSDIYAKLRRAQAKQDYDALRAMGYDCEHCEARLDTNTFNSINNYMNGFAKHFSLQFTPIINDFIGFQE